MNKVSCNGWCYPAIIYVILAVISLIGTLLYTPEVPEQNSFGMKLLQVVAHIIIAAFWTFVIYSLCANCHYTWAWIVLLLPLIGFGVVLLLAASVAIFKKASTPPTHR